MPQEQNAIQVLIVSGQVTPEHDPKVNSMLRRMLESTGRFKVKITEEFRGATPETLLFYDLVLVNYDGDVPFTNHPPIPLGAQAEKSIIDFVRSGKGVLFYHSSAWRTPWSEDILRIMGGYFDPDNGSRKNPILDFTVKVPNATHPVTAGLALNWNTVTEDLFAGAVWTPEGNVEVLATVFDDIEGYRSMPAHVAHLLPPGGPEAIVGVNTDQPVAWVRSEQEGRVAVLTIGHGPDTIRRPQFVALCVRMAEWAATGKVTIEAPNLKGENRRRAWPYYEDISIVEYASLTV
jgi:hypothetical protein